MEELMAWFVLYFGIFFGLLIFAALVLTIAVWTVVWKGLALWNAAKLGHKWWFIILLVVNTLGILEIIYLFLVIKWHKNK